MFVIYCFNLILHPHYFDTVYFFNTFTANNPRLILKKFNFFNHWVFLLNDYPMPFY